jgi:hypothetical protein
MTYRWKSVAIAAACMLALSACAATRSEVAVPTQSAKQPDSGTAVVVLPPVDARRFEAAPEAPSTPSLKLADQINNPQITSRALGRKRNGYGMAMGDVLLNPPQTASSLVGDAVKAGLRDAGYRVVDASDPAAASAPRVNVRIEEFWTWITPGFGSIKLDNSTNLTLDGTLPSLPPGAKVNVHETKGYFVITESEWAPFIDSALAKVREQVRTLVSPKTAALR